MSLRVRSSQTPAALTRPTPAIQTPAPAAQSAATKATTGTREAPTPQLPPADREQRAGERALSSSQSALKAEGRGAVGAQLKARAAAESFSLDLAGKPGIVASGHSEVHQFTGGASYGGDTVKISGLPDGRIVLEDLKTDYSGGEDVVMQPDRHGGFHASTSKGVWTMAPADKNGMRALAFAPSERTTPMVSYRLGHPQPAKDLAAWHGSKLALKAEEGLSGEPFTKSKINITLDTSGDSLAVKLPDGTVKTLSHRLDTGGFADKPDSYAASFTANLDPTRGVYQIRHQTEAGTFSAEIGPLHKGGQAPPQKLRASIESRGEFSTSLASLATLPKGKMLLRLNQSNGWNPVALYFDAKTGKGESLDGGVATLSKPDAKGARTVKYQPPQGDPTIIKLAPFDEIKAVAEFAGKTATIEIYAPKSRESNGNPSHEQVLKTFTLRFGDEVKGGNSVPVKIDGITWPDDMSMMATEHGDFTINLSNSRLWLHPTGDGSMEALAEWSFNAPLTKGKVSVSD